MSTIDVQTCTNILPPFQLIKNIELGYNDGYVFDVTANSQYAITSASDNFIRLYDLATLQLAQTIRSHDCKISQMKLKSDQYLFTVSEDSTLKRWDLRTSSGPVQCFKCKRERGKNKIYIETKKCIHIDKKPLTAFDINCNDTMAIAGTELSFDDHSVDLAFFDTRHTSLLHTFTESHNDDITEVMIVNIVFALSLSLNCIY